MNLEGVAANSPPQPRSRIVLIHAGLEAVRPMQDAFAASWPGADVSDLVDTSLSKDLQAGVGAIDSEIVGRFRMLGQYALSTALPGAQVDGILFTCSAFRGAIDVVKQALPVHVLKVNEAAFHKAVQVGSRLGLAYRDRRRGTLWPPRRNRRSRSRRPRNRSL